jgi:GntR family transcriptional regulator, transcriptional repressor for pyruvate dehydrogenase complex
MSIEPDHVARQTLLSSDETGSPDSGTARPRSATLVGAPAAKPVQLRQPRLAEMVAKSLRGRILDRSLAEGDTLPRQEDLLAEFGVSPPAVREALRILETEGLISVRRGNVGGAIVHVPKARGVAYMISLVLQLGESSLDDVGQALRELEPLCAAMCANRPDRHSTVVPKLRAIIADQAATMDSIVYHDGPARDFHETLATSCGNDTLTLVVGALESLWTAHEHRLHRYQEATSGGRSYSLRAHEKLLAAIEEGDVESAAKLARRHVEATQAFMLEKDENHEVIADLVREVV